MKQQYTLGFIFNEALDHVVLMHKAKPEWQAGKLNGIGGKVEEGEDHLSCMVREAKEETNLETRHGDWVFLGEMGSDGWGMQVFTLTHIGDMQAIQSMEAEKVEWFPVAALPDNVLGNLYWLVPLAIDKIKNQEFKKFVFHYNS